MTDTIHDVTIPLYKSEIEYLCEMAKDEKLPLAGMIGQIIRDAIEKRKEESGVIGVGW